MLDEKWISDRVGTVYVYWEQRVPQYGLFAKCVQRSLETISIYRPEVDAEQYRTLIEQEVNKCIQEGR